MKNLKSISLVALMLAMCVTLNAQPQQKGPQKGKGQGKEQAKEQKEKPTAEELAAKKTAALKEKLSLDAKQEKAISALFLASAKEMEAKAAERAALKEKGEKPAKPAVECCKECGSKEAFTQKAKMEAAKKEQLTKIMKVLNDSQKVDFAIMISQMKDKKGQKGQQGRQGMQQGRRGGPQAQGMQQGGRRQQQGQQQGQRPQGKKPQKPQEKPAETEAAK